MLPTRAIGVLEMFSTSRAGVDMFSDQLIEDVQRGDLDPLKLRVWIKTIETIIDRVNKETLINQMTAAEKYPENSFEFSGATIQKAELGTTYDFGICNDPVHKSLTEISKHASKQLKEREEFLKSLKSPMTILDEGTGEVSKITPPLKKSTSALKVTIR